MQSEIEITCQFMRNPCASNNIYIYTELCAIKVLQQRVQVEYLSSRKSFKLIAEAIMR